MRKKEDRQLIKEDNIIPWFKDNHSDNQSYLFILGIGFDKRMCAGIECFSSIGIPFDVWEIHYDEGDASPSIEYSESVESNVRQLEDILYNNREYIGSVEHKKIELWQEDAIGSGREDNPTRFVGEINASKLIKKEIPNIKHYSDIIIDVSALPQTIYFCVINTLLKECDDGQRIDIVVNENYTTDIQIQPAQAEETAHEIQGYTSPSESLDSVLIWYPVLGEVNLTYLGKYANYLNIPSKVDEVCPVVPFPSINIRRADMILSGYARMLFKEWGIEKKNIIYASETNPILVCQNLVKATQNYKTALRPLGECKFVFSAITSKLMSVGMLLAAFDLKTDNYNVSILGISNKGYHINKDVKKGNTPNKLICIAV